MAQRGERAASGRIVEELTLGDLCRAGGFHAEWVVELVEYGVLEPEGPDAAAWRFESASLGTAVRAWRLHRDLGVNLPGVALALALIAERDRLRRRLGAEDPFAPPCPD